MGTLSLTRSVVSLTGQREDWNKKVLIPLHPTLWQFNMRIRYPWQRDCDILISYNQKLILIYKLASYDIRLSIFLLLLVYIKYFLIFVLCKIFLFLNQMTSHHLNIAGPVAKWSMFRDILLDSCRGFDIKNLI